jgi:subtilisin family serine protease
VTPTLRLGRSNIRIPLRKGANSFSVVSRDASSFEDVRRLSSLSTILATGPETFTCSVLPGTTRDDCMDNLRRRGHVVHHTYYIEAGFEAIPFVILDRVNVGLTDASDEGALDSLSTRHALRRLGMLGKGIAVFGLTTATGMNPLKLAEALRGFPGVAFCEPDHVLRFTRMSPWHLARTVAHPDGSSFRAGVRAEEAWAFAGKGSPDVIIAVLDDGFDLENPDLASGTREPSDFGVGVLAEADERVIPDDTAPLASAERGDYHGTPCAGLAIGRGVSQVHGIAPGCSWMPVRAPISAIGHNAILQILKYISKRADVVSCSWGQQPSAFTILSASTQAVLEELATSGGRQGRGLVMCFAAGNSNLPTYLPAGERPDGMEYYDPTTGETLGHFFQDRDIHSGWTESEHVIVVGASTARNTKALYSNWGANVWVVAPSDDWHPAEPGRRIGAHGLFTTDNEHCGLGLADVGLASTEMGEVTRDMGGTSGSTPQVAGVCGLILSVAPYLGALEVKRVLAESAEQEGLDPGLPVKMHNNAGQTGAFLGDQRRSLWYGFGRLDAFKAVQMAAARLPP